MTVIDALTQVMAEVQAVGKNDRNDHGGCRVESCDRDVNARGWCKRHYESWRRHGSPTGMSRVVADPEGNFWRKVDVGHPLGCWEWTGAVTAAGYGLLTVDGNNRYAHRAAYERMIGPIGDGLQIDHLCRNRVCVNPDHLEPVTHGENVRRGVAGHRLSQMNRERAAR